MTRDRRINPMVRCVGCGVNMHKCIKIEDYERCRFIWLCYGCRQIMVVHRLSKNNMTPLKDGDDDHGNNDLTGLEFTGK